MSALILLGLSLDWASTQEIRCLSSQFRKPGDYILGGLFPFTVYTLNMTDRTLPDVYTCDRLYAAGLIWALGMKFAVEEINNSTTLLPGISLGYDIYDSCMEPVVVLQPSLLFLSKMGTGRVTVSCNYTDYQTRVTAVIGPHNSELSTVTAKLFSFFQIPQVSYGATSDKLNYEELYSFFRTVPSDKSQMEAIFELLLAFQWNWIAVVGSDDDYGREGIGLLTSMVANKSICIAYEGLIPADMSQANLQEKMMQTIHSINETRVNVIVLFSKDRPVREFFKMWFKLGLEKKVWLATEAWVMSDVVISLQRARDIGTVIGFVIKAGEVPGFEDYAFKLLELTQEEAFCQASWEQASQLGLDVLGPQCQLCDTVSQDKVAAVLHHRQTFAVYTAVYGVAHALHKALHCQNGLCKKRTIKPWQLLENLNGLHFSMHNESYHFDEHRSINMGYEVLCWSWPTEHIKMVSIGDFNGTLTINQTKVRFHTKDGKAPPSECLTTCLPGQIRRMKGFHLCCYDCIDCESDTFCQSSDDSTCAPCPEHQWSPRRSTRCFDRGEKYLFWSEPLAVVAMGLVLLAVALAGLSGALFLKNLRTPAVRAAGGAQSLLALCSLALMCLSALLHMGRPSATLCQAQQPSCALCLCLCFSILAVKALQITLANDFADSRPNALHALIRRRPWALVGASLLVEALLCFVYVYRTSSILVKDYNLLPSEVLLQCQIHSWLLFAMMQGHNGLLAFLSFLCTFMVQSSPKRYNLARSVTFAMLAYFISLVIFIPTYATVRQVDQPLIQISAMLLCAFGVLAAYYLPICYILWFKPEWNTLDYFHDYAQERLQEKEASN